MADIDHSQIVHDDDVIVLTNEFDQIRQCTGMYIGVGETEGVIHLCNEVMTNSIDEAVNPEVIKAGYGEKIEFYFDEKTCRFTIVDNGRGMPLEKMMELVGRKHAGTKFRKITSANRYSGGQNGVGITVTAALSDQFSVQCWRNGQTRALHVEGNELVDQGYEKCSGDKHGTMTSFIPSKSWIGDFSVDTSQVEDYLRRLSYILPERVKIKYVGSNHKGDKKAITYKAQGLASAVEYLGHDLVFSPVWLKVPEVVVDFDDPDREPDYFKMEFAFSYDRSLDQSTSVSFCNYVATKDGGYHENVVQKCLADYFTKQADLLDPNHKYKVIQDDCRYGLAFAVNCDHSNPSFEGQHKSRVGQKDIMKYARKPIMDVLDKFFETNNGLLRKICSYLHQVAKARLEINKVKTKTVKSTNFVDDAKMKVFSNISDRNYSGYKELILAEGDSALSAIGSARNVKNQAIFAVTGVVPNTYNMTTAQVLKSPMYAMLLHILGCGIGDSFDITKLKWNAIVIISDSDVDGYNITSLLCVFFLKHLPQLVTNGYVYKVVPPLYLIDTKPIRQYYGGKEFLFNKTEIDTIFNTIVARNIKLSVVHPRSISQIARGHGDVEELNVSQAMTLLQGNSEYYDELDNVHRRTACPIDVLEPVCYFHLISRGATDPQGMFKELISKRFPELTYDEMAQSIYGSYNGENIALIVDDLFFHVAKRFFRLMSANPVFWVLYKGKKKEDDDPQKNDWTLATYGGFMEFCKKTFVIPIRQRYKGLGEAETLVVFASMVNPKTRKIVRITAVDLPRSLETIRRLHSDEPEMREVRRKMLKDADITQKDIDN